MAGWYHWLNGHEFGWTPGVGEGQGGLACCNSWGHKEADMTDWTELNWTGLQHTRPPCPSPAPGVYSNSHPSGRWCHPSISSSVFPFSSLLHLASIRVFSNESVLHMRWPKYWCSASTSVFPMNIQDWFSLRWTDFISLQSKDSQESSPIPQFKSINYSPLSCLYSPTLTSIHDYWKNHSFDYMDFCWQSNVSPFEYAI